jgi:hypothetical protein
LIRRIGTIAVHRHNDIAFCGGEASPDCRAKTQVTRMPYDPHTVIARVRAGYQLDCSIATAIVNKDEFDLILLRQLFPDRLE